MIQPMVPPAGSPRPGLLTQPNVCCHVRLSRSMSHPRLSTEHRQLSFGTVDREGWLYRCIRTAHSGSSYGMSLQVPPVQPHGSHSLRTVYGRVFFANLLTRQTRWFPPHTVGWMNGLIAARRRTKWQGSVYSHKQLPWCVARMRVEGGAPYLHAYGTPQYQADSFDSTATPPVCCSRPCAEVVQPVMGPVTALTTTLEKEGVDHCPVFLAT